jgi:hypothetical protein
VKSGQNPDLQPLSGILGELSGEICRPLGMLQQGIETLLSDPDEAPTDAERSQAATMITLCDEIDRLTRHYLGSPGQNQSR